MITINFPHGISYNYNEKRFINDNDINIVRYLKGIYRSKDSFISKFINKFKGKQLDFLVDYLLETYDIVEPFTYKEAFNLKNVQFQALVFGSINITEMIENLGYERIKTEGIEVKRKIFDKQGNFKGYKEYHNIYETHRVFGKELGLSNDVYAVKCWCTSTNKEHWLWIEQEYKDEPLKAIASTFRIHKNLIPYIKELKRQGDIMLCEMNEDIEPIGDIVALTPEEYFGLLTSES